ncbi:lamin-B receptor-like isoform X2 [Mizuhopecten yessoensis]|uniref:lamin-B receptor-like isoform X2 n=1 Tax=Mizuhopecten yessoensis TaxID=6573 RepID=UPI000B45BDC9|nr:lamin-B receptor-like isoform X2 [Mizuhopecten yessoensis]
MDDDNPLGTMQRRPLRSNRGGRQEEPDTEEKKDYYQFGGPIAAFLTSVCFIGLTYIVVEKIQSGKWQMLRLPEFPGHPGGWLDLRAAAIFLGWLGAQFVLYLLPFGGPIELGTPTKDTGRKLAYRLNESTYYNWFIGAELNPRFGFLDLKLVLFRSSIIGWMIFNWVNVVDAFETGHLTPSLLLVSSLQLVYVLDTFWFEAGTLVSRDIIYEALGFNLLTLFLMIPFTFCVQTRYLATTGFTLPWYCLIAIISLNVTGYWILRGSNSEKNNFRRNPKDPAFANYQTLPTQVKGKNLLVSGWWGMSRHPNYFGDIIINFSFALPTGFGCFLPYLNPLFLVMMLVDRERIDGEECRQRYGEAWDKYCEKVKYRIIPCVY